MAATPKSSKPTTINAIAKKANPTILQLFPSLNFSRNSMGAPQKKNILQQLACLKQIGSQEGINNANLAKCTGLDRATLIKAIKQLATLDLIKTEKKEKTVTFSATTLGLTALMAFEEFRDWTKTKSSLAIPSKKNDPLAYALLVIGFCANKPDSIYQALCKYANQGNTLESITREVSAEALLSFYRQELHASSPVPPAYLSVFKEFTTTGFQEVFRMLLIAIKPTAEDYNWLVEFFNEVSEFYFDPARKAFLNLLPENQKLQADLELFKKSQDQQIKKQDGNLEVTFSIPGTGISKADAMPPHLRAIGMRLILEPIKFINKELVEYFWTTN